MASGGTYIRRRASAVVALPAHVGALLVTRPENVRYLSGFTGSNAALLVSRDGSSALATDGRYVLQAAAEAPDVEVVQTSRVATALVDRAAAERLARLAFEAHHVTADGLR